MANQLADDKHRVSYTEFKETHDRLALAAEAARVTISDLIREATYQYLQKIEDAGGVVTSVPKPSLPPKKSGKKPYAKKKQS